MISLQCSVVSANIILLHIVSAVLMFTQALSDSLQRKVAYNMRLLAVSDQVLGHIQGNVE